MAKLATAFEREGILKEKIVLYWEYLKGIPVGELERAVDEIIYTRKISSLPTVAEIAERASMTSEASLTSQALTAWNRANDLLISGIPAKDEMLSESIRLAFGSWALFGQCDPGQEGYDRNLFVKVYKDVARKKAEERLLRVTSEPKQLEPK